MTVEISQRAPMTIADQPIAGSQRDTARRIATALADLEAQAWLIDRQLAAVLLGAARLSLRDLTEE